nr:uncharacterized protein LOC105333042 [Crassostrea gigas]
MTINQSCLYNRQCTGTKFAGLCRSQKCTCDTGYMLIDNNCYKDHVPVGGFCILDKQCTGSNNSETCDNGRCRCLDGHVLLELECIQGNLSLNQSCTVHEQCSSSNYSRCVEEKCTCMEGYTAENLTHCIKFQPNEFEHSVRNPQDNNIGKILGTLFGGILIGVILTAVVAFLMFKKMQTKIRKREEPSVSFANDVIYSSAIVVERGDITGSQANYAKRKVVNALPYACAEKGAVYSLVTSKPSVEHPTTEGVYNHLREQEKKDDNEHNDNYDHACAASYLGTEPSVYSNMP